MKIPQLREALQSRFEVEHHGIMVAQLLAHIDTLDAALQNLTERIEFVLTPHAQTIELLCTIPGVQAHAAQVLIAECNLDMTIFPMVGHFASWAGACPGHNESAGRRRSGRTRPWTAVAHRAANRMRRRCCPDQDTYLAAPFAQLRGRRGEPKAIGAIRHDLLVAYDHPSATKSHSKRLDTPLAEAFALENSAWRAQRGTAIGLSTRDRDVLHAGRALGR